LRRAAEDRVSHVCERCKGTGKVLAAKAAGGRGRS
jgi:hypothetical protein